MFYWYALTVPPSRRARIRDQKDPWVNLFGVPDMFYSYTSTVVHPGFERFTGEVLFGDCYFGAR